ncbi:MAG: acetolactate synthase [Rhodospirillaceae bacterium]|nr:acetolactate synthase [Rhodospirillaceae bacterium]
MMRLADYVMHWLIAKNVDTVFTVSGGGSISLCDALLKADGLDYICCHHEQAVAISAEGYTRSCGKIGVGLVTTGPGGTNAITGVAGAWIDSIPQLIISGQVFLNQTIKDTGLRQLGVQEINIVDIVQPITKYATMLEDPNNIKFELEKAFHIAQSGRPGPVWLDIPADIQTKEINPGKLHTFNATASRRSVKIKPKELEKIAKKLMNSKRPMVHIGHGIRSTDARKGIIDFVVRHNIPLATTWNATDCIASSHPNFIGRPGAFAERGANFIVQNSDFYISIGSRLPFMVTGYNSKDFARNAYKVMVDIDPIESNKISLDIDQRITGDSYEFIQSLCAMIDDRWQCDSSWLKKCQSIRKKYPIILPEYRKQKKWVNSYYFIDKLSHLLPSNAVVVTDMGLSFVGTHQAFRVKSGQRVFTNSGHAAMGWGLPAAIGASLSSKNRPIICISGEGGLMMNLQELSTANHNKIPLKLFIYNNGGYLTIKQTQQLGFDGRLMGSTEDSGISFPDFRKIAASFGFSYVKISNHRKLNQKLIDILQQDGPIICELLINPEQPQIPKAINRKNSDGTTRATALEDMYPFLPENEIKSNLSGD